MENRVRLAMTSLPENVGLARVLVLTFAAQLQFTLAELEQVRVAVSEAVTNAVVHAYGGGPGSVVLELSARDGELEVMVIDEGRGIPDVARARQAEYSTDPDRLGLGFSLMESFMDQVEVESAPGRGTRVRMRKRARNLGPVPMGC